MMHLTQKCQYGVRAAFELAKRYGGGPTAVTDIAATQHIPVRFLEVIMKELRSAGVVRSQRGVRGGYILAMPPSRIALGRIIGLIDGEPNPARCTACGGDQECPFGGQCAFAGVWRKVMASATHIYDTTTLQDLLEGADADPPSAPAASP